MPHRTSLSGLQEKPNPKELLSVDRAVSDLRRGGIVVVRGNNQKTRLVLAAEGATTARLDRLKELSSGNPYLAITGKRAEVLGLTDYQASVVVLRPKEGLTAWVASDLADPLSDPERLSGLNADSKGIENQGCEAAAIGLAKIARMLPAVVVADLADAKAAAYPVAWAENNDLLVVESEHIFSYELNAAQSLSLISEAKVPLLDAEDTKILTFRPGDGGIEHLAIVVGKPDPTQPVLTRLHSECFTGDLLGSLRCDCGDQLRGAIAEIAQQGSGVLLYLAQEGRGIGLVNKLRAYELQDRGADTIDANEQLGFDADERVYLPAAEMLRQLNYKSIRLLTNNPDKVQALSGFGIEIKERVAHAFPSNQHNELYLNTKAARSGHLF
ncbi:MAG: GTP cyclohydrolase II [Alphaproteobacteria bacterium]|nr:GTP cyclohydrolase II [Alphaproteobacteria bacterium]